MVEVGSEKVKVSGVKDVLGTRSDVSGVDSYPEE
jgi:hypothetical protein